MGIRRHLFFEKLDCNFIPNQLYSRKDFQVENQAVLPSGFSADPPPESQTGCQPGEPDLQPRPQEGEVVTYGEVQRGGVPTCEIRSDVRHLPLELDGVEGMIGIHFYF